MSGVDTEGPDRSPLSGSSAPGRVPLDWVSVSALISSLVICAAPVGMLLGVAGIVRTKDGQRRGRWAAIAGLAISTVVTAAMAIAVVAGGSVLIASALNDLNHSTAEAGQCIDLDFFEYPNATSCAAPHEGEIVWSGRVDNAMVREWAEAEYVDDFCINRGLTAEHESAMLDPAYTIDYWVDGWDWEPTRGEWMICYLTATEGDLDAAIGALAS